MNTQLKSPETINSHQKWNNSTVEEKIYLEKHLPFSPGEKDGPTVELFFHELLKEPTFGQKILKYAAGVFLTVLFMAVLPIVLLLTASARASLFTKVEIPGKRGSKFQQYLFTTADNGNELWFGGLLKKTRVAKLPSVINIWKGEMNLVGPHAYSAEWCNCWNSRLTDFYKRFSYKPGLFGVTSRITDKKDYDQVENNLRYELRYIVHSSFDQDLRHIFK